MKQSIFVLPLSAAFALTACISFGSKPPPVLMRLTPSATLQANASRTAGPGEAVTVMVPTVPQELATLRVPVRTGATQVAYLKDAQWVETPNALFARLLSETIAVTTGKTVLDSRQFTVDPGLRLTGQLQAFGVDADGGEAVIIYDAALARSPDKVETRRFESHIPVSPVDANTVPPALNQAANQVADEVARWIQG
jgi:cholesterol transport system auxiliary component